MGDTISKECNFSIVQTVEITWELFSINEKYAYPTGVIDFARSI
jgi:hypothetical protein